MTKERNPTPEELEQRKRQFIPKREPLYYGKSYEEVMRKDYCLFPARERGEEIEGSEEWYILISERERLEEFEK